MMSTKAVYNRRLSHNFMHAKIIKHLMTNVSEILLMNRTISQIYYFSIAYQY